MIDWPEEAANFDEASAITDWTDGDEFTIANGETVGDNSVYEPATITDYGTGNDVFDSGHTVTNTFEESGVALYFCNPHRAIHGQVGAIIVE